MAQAPANKPLTQTDPRRESADAAVSELMERVGERVRRARDRKGIPRRVLSEISGVSPRYLAQLEAGEGNISIGLLQRVSIALGYRIDWLIGEDDPWSSEAVRVADLYRSAAPDVQRQVLKTLVQSPTAATRARRICLVGLRGAGKSTLGQMAGSALGLPFVELNDEIERQSGIPLGEVMALYGQEGYRQLEAQAVNKVIAGYDTLVLAVAGGIVEQPETYNMLLGYFHTIWIKTTPDEHMSRVRAQGDERPMAGNPEAMEQLKSILTGREAQYQKALFQLDTSGQSPEVSLAALLDMIRDRQFLSGSGA